METIYIVALLVVSIFAVDFALTRYRRSNIERRRSEFKDAFHKYEASKSEKLVNMEQPSSHNIDELTEELHEQIITSSAEDFDGLRKK